MTAEIKNNLYESLPLMKRDGSQITLGSRQSGKRRVVVEYGEMIPDQMENLSRVNIISVRKIRKRKA